MATPIPSNLARFSLQELMSATGAELCGKPFEFVSGVETDTRKPLRDKLYVALVGERFDGHDFVSQAIERGAAAALVERATGMVELPQLVVPSTLTAFGALARAHRLRGGQKLCAIVGSAGKTTTRVTTAALLEAVEPTRVHATPGNLNNRVGVPSVLLGLEPRHSWAVVEVGTNLRGEVAELGQVVRPDVAVLTLVDWEHAQGIGDLDAIEAEEGDMFAALGEQGIAVANGDDARAVRQLSRCRSEHRVTFGVSGAAQYRVIERRPAGLQQVITLGRPRGADVEIRTALLGMAGAMSWAAGVAAAEAILGRALESEHVDAACSAVATGAGGRLEPRELGDGTCVLDDTYNANPGSVRSSVHAARELARVRGARLVMVLGEMRELGAESARAHRELADLVEPADRLVAVSGEARLLADAAEARGAWVRFADDAAEAAELASSVVESGDVVLVKGSRGVRLETVVDTLMRRSGGAA